jgi:hypothetical protein
MDDLIRTIVTIVLFIVNALLLLFTIRLVVWFVAWIMSWGW